MSYEIISKYKILHGIYYYYTLLPGLRGKVISQTDNTITLQIQFAGIVTLPRQSFLRHAIILNGHKAN